MAAPVTTSRDFTRIIQDVSRDRLPRGAVWNMVNMIPGEIDAPLAKRGGWDYASQDLTGTLAGADVVRALIYAPFSSGNQLVGVTTNLGTASRCVQIVSTSSTTDRGSSITPDENPCFYRDNVVFCSNSGSGTPLRYDGSSNATVLTGSPPTGRRSTIYKDRLVLGYSTSNVNRVWFSEAGDINDWDTTNRWIDTTGEVTALYALRNAILVFHPSGLERIIGSVPPPGTDMYLQPLYDTGTLQARSLAGTDQFVCFANAAGVYMTDGSQVIDMTRAGGIKALWQTRVAAASSLALAGGYYRGYYWVTIIDSNTTTQDTFAVHVDSKRWLRFDNITAHCYARRLSGNEELYWGDSSEARANTLSGIFTPASGNKNDDDGTAVGCSVELPYVEIGNSKGRIRRAYCSYDLRDAASDNPTLTMSYVTSPESTSYSSISSTLPETLAKTYKRRSINKEAFGVGLKLAQTTASAQTRIYALGIEGHARESSRTN
jgi:hypothetical protein